MSLVVGVLCAVLAQAPAGDAAPDAGVPEPELALGVGTQRVWSLPADATGIAVGDPKVLEVRLLGARQLLVVGVAEGQSGVLVMRPGRSPLSFLVRVRGSDPGYGIQEFKALLKPGPGLRHRMVGDRIFLEGVVETEDELERVALVLAAYTQVRCFATVDPKLVKAKADEANRELIRAGLRNARVTVFGDRLVLEGAVADEAEQRKAEAMVQAVFGPFQEQVAALKRAGAK